MKIHYKTILNDRNTDIMGTERYVIIEDKNNHSGYLVDFCCEDMERELLDIFDVQQYGDNSNRYGNEDIKIGLLPFLGYGDDYRVRSHTFVKFCPFCGERIELVHDYIARQEIRQVNIPAKTIPATTETVVEEVRL